MKYKVYFAIIAIITFLFLVIIPNYSLAISPSEVLNANLTSKTMSELKTWYTNLANQGGAGQSSDAIAKIKQEVSNRLASSNITVGDIYIGLDIIGDTDTLPRSTLTNLQSRLSSQNVPGNPTGQSAYQRITSSLGVRESSGTTVDPIADPNFYTPTEDNSTELAKIGRIILAVINVVGVVIAVVALGIIGLRYMLGSVEERAQYKETLVPYVIGLVMLGGITSIVNIIYNISIKIGN